MERDLSQDTKIKPGKLFLIPCPLSDSPAARALGSDALGALLPIRDFVVENEKSAWRFLSKVFDQESLSHMNLRILDEHSQASALPPLLEPALAGRALGLISEAGCPGVADPGAALVHYAHVQGIEIRPLIGPCSMVLALMASGLNGQSFRFCGYLPRERPERIRTLKELERRALKEGETQIFIETPYRNDHMLSDMLSCLNPGTWVCVASDISAEGESIISAPAGSLAANKPSIGKRPTVFLIGTPA